MFIILDNAESILDPEGRNAEEIYTIVEELCRFDNICLCITSRISTIPPDCKTLDIPTLSMEAACETFYRIYQRGEQSGAIENILKQLDFHPLAVTLLATVAQQNKWGVSRLTREWESQRTDVLQTGHKQSLAATIELSLASPMFQELGPDARPLLKVVAFFPQGVDENNLDWLFPTIPNRKDIFDKFCVLSLTNWSNDGFATMLAPLRDYLFPRAPQLSPLLCTTKEHYLHRLSSDPCPHCDPEKTQWITSEDVNVEHLLSIFTSVDANSPDVWDACAKFLGHLHYHKQRLVILGPTIEGLPDNHPHKLKCLEQLSELSSSVGQYVQGKRLDMCALKLWRKQRNDHKVAQTLVSIAYKNHAMRLFEEAIPQEKEASEIHKRLGDKKEQINSLQHLALLFVQVKQVDTAKEAVSQVLKLSSGTLSANQYCEHHHILGHLHESKGETEAAICHFRNALQIVIHHGLEQTQIQILRCLVQLLLDAERFNDAQIHLNTIKLLEVNDAYELDRHLVTQAYIYFGRGRFAEAKFELSRIIGTRERAGSLGDLLGDAKVLLQVIEVGTNNLITAMGEAASHTISPSSGEPDQLLVCGNHHILGHIYGSRGNKELAINHHETALGIATSLNLQEEQAEILHCLFHLLEEERPDDAQVYLKRFQLLMPVSEIPFGLDSKVAKYLFALFAFLCFFH